MKTNFKIEEDVANIKLNKNIYPKEVIIQTTYVMLDKYYFLIDEDNNYFIIYMKLKEDKDMNNFEIKKNLEIGIYELFDELIESESYFDQLKKTKGIRQIILEKALLIQSVDDELIGELEKENINE